MSLRRRFLALGLLAVLVAGCDEDLELAQDFIRTWAADHAVQLGQAALGVPTGDTMVDAAAIAAPTINDIMQADAAMDEGRAKRDPAKMDEALEIRPRDWTYQMSRGNLALEQGDINTFRKHKAAWPADASAASPTSVARQDYDELMAVERRLVPRTADPTGGFKSYNQCVAVYDALIAHSGSSSPADSSQDHDTWTLRRQGCETIPH